MINNKSPNVMLAIGMKKPAPGLPKSVKGSFGGPKPSPLQSGYTPSAAGDKSTQTPNPMDATGAKVSQEEAGYLPPENLCGACEYFTKESGDCQKVDGPVMAGGGCKLFEAAGSDATMGETDQDPMSSGMNANPAVSGGI